MTSTMSENPLLTKDDVEQFVIDLWTKLTPYYSEGKALLLPKGALAGHSEFVSGIEGFSRILWGAVPLLMSDKAPELWEQHLTGIKNGTNPEHEEYWGEIHDFDQRIVEMAAIGYGLCLAPEKMWEPLSDVEKSNLTNWLLQANEHKTPDSNWILFVVMVNIGLKNVGATYSQSVLDSKLDRLEAFYIGNGWYKDGEITAHVDYYTPMAIHYFCLFYAKIMEDEDVERSTKYKKRAARFAEDFIYWFGEDGSALPYGRSLTYRFAQSAFWSALAFAEVDVFRPGVVKGLILRNLRYWIKQDIFQPDGTLSVGYHYPNLLMAENYNAPGSPYWALKTMLILAMDEKSPFWQEDEEELPHLEQRKIQGAPYFAIERDRESNHVAAFHTGSLHTNEQVHVAAKYEKFVYSNHFGFSVSRSEWGLEQGAYDSMLAVSEQDNLYRVKRKVEEREITDKFLYFKWSPWANVTIKTWIIPGLPWHIRIHEIETGRTLDVADGGFAINTSSEDIVRKKHSNYVDGLATYAGLSGAVDLMEKGKARIIHPNANTNLLYKKSAIPTIEHRLEVGKHLLVHGFYGQAARGEGAEWKEIPFIKGDTIFLKKDVPVFTFNQPILMN
ncbi:hypothetical protein GGQ92_003098 [Gracilibacillus halotolerans]|uniref:DUF2264 domain-containing protein n=1 Tax=Gracilibacillus halotolerans TaxID=74386 RepID=A0A841RSU0_9BACI|nr:DUF2264 domain-containing protein [Gracilibacillus halotolerans]MBB6514275.1 hypothetical protein [Gracilibacillus halotolerans]